MSDHLSFLEPIIGQSAAVSSIRRALRLRALSDGQQKQPLAFLFAGPEGCGKSFAAHRLALQGDRERPILRIAMGTYQSDNEAAALIGLRAIYNSARPGLLTAFVRENPDALIIFEDFDRAHPNVQDVLAPMLARGVLTDQCGFFEGDPRKGVQIAPPEVDFSRTLIVFTTALGRKLYDDERWLEQVAAKPGLLNSALIQTVAGETSDHFSDKQAAVGRALMAELGKAEWILFNRLSMEALLAIARTQFDALDAMARLAGFSGVQLGDGSETASKELLTAIVLANGPEPKPALLEAVDLARTYLAPALEYAGGGCVTVDLSEAAKTNLRAVLTELGEQTLRNLFRNNWMLHCTVAAAPGAQGPVLTVDGCEASRVPNRQDYGSSGLTVDLPEQRFSDIAGHLDAKRRLQEVIGMLRQPEKLSRWNVEAPRGMLLWGPPGTGKTMLARAFACEADLPFIATTGTEMLDPRRVARVFELARKYAPAAIFIDEIDALGRRDKDGAIHAINQMLAEIDGFDGEGRLFVIAASNLPERVDPAILRSGRLDLHVHIPPLDTAARKYFIDRLRSMVRLNKQDWQRIIDLSAGMTGADLEKLRRELAYDLLRSGKSRASSDDIIEHINTLKYGVRDTRERTREELEHIAYHEAGHVLLSQMLNPEVGIRNVSITGRGKAAGFVEFDAEAHHNRRMTRKEVKEDLIILMGGRIAQMIKFGEEGIDAGVADDLAKARKLARRAIEEWGMEMVDATETERHVGQWLTSAEIEARQLLEKHREALETTYCRLISKVE
jgi:cell division protease FtsH